MFWSVGWPLFRAEGFFYNLDILYGGVGIGKLQFLIIIFFNFWSLKPWIRIGSGSGLVFILRCWIRIRMKWIRIRNPGLIKLNCLQGNVVSPEQGFGSVSGSAFLDPDPHSNCGSGSGSRRAKMTHKNRKQYRFFMFWSAGCSLLRAEGFSCSLGVLYGGLGISKWQFLIKELKIQFPAVIFYFILGLKPWIRIRN
jgi:hypothetical protein